jgi:hypothetical protein
VVVHEQVLIDGQIAAAQEFTMNVDSDGNTVPIAVPPGTHTVVARAFWERSDGRLGQMPDVTETLSGCGPPCPPPAVVPSGQFGNTTPGNMSGDVGLSIELGSVFTLGSTAAPVDFKFYASGGTGDQKFLPIVYNADGAGQPTSLVMSGHEVNVPAGAPAQWFSSPLPVQTLPPGNYLLGLMSGPVRNNAQIYFTTGTGRFFKAQGKVGEYPPGYPIPLNMWDADTPSNESLSVYIDFGTPTTGGCGKIIVEKQTDPDGAADSFTFTGTAAGSISDGQQIVVDNLVPGQYTSTESVPTGWDLTSISCDDANSTGDVPSKTATFNVEANETVKCTFTDRKRGKIIVEKQTDPDGAAGSFTFTGTAAGTIGDNGQIVVDNLAPGTYYSTETVPSGWSLVSISCNDSNSTGDVPNKKATFRLEAGETVKCVFTDKKTVTAPGTGTPGFWKNHPNAWPVSTITVGGVTYTKQQAINKMNGGKGGNAYDILFFQLIAAKLNVLAGNASSCIASTIAAADSWLIANGPATKTSSNAWKTGEPLKNTLEAYNSGLLCAPHRA